MYWAYASASFWGEDSPLPVNCKLSTYGAGTSSTAGAAATFETEYT